MKKKQLQEILQKIKNVKIAIYGDFCLDAYWILNPLGGEVSVETGLHSEAVQRHYYSLGGAANVTANLAALKPSKILPIGVVGNDIYGKELLRQFKEMGIDTSAIVVQNEDFDTITFAKRYMETKEQPRIDFGFFNKRSKETDDEILANIENSLKTYDVIIFNQQVPGSITNEEFFDKANKLFETFDDKIILFDSRHYGHKFKNVFRKTNDIEAANLNDVKVGPDDIIALKDSKGYIQNLYNESNKPVFLTRGKKGILVCNENGIHEIPGILMMNNIDTVGAGDATISALSLALATGADTVSSAEFANYAASVTVQKLFRTGTADADEIMAQFEDSYYVYKPELAEDVRQSEYFDNSEIELCCPEEEITLGNIKHAIFDHDGTISTLRHGWEHIMEPVMVKAVMGAKFETADEKLYHKVLIRVRDYIDKSTGIQTILQMQALVEMVKEFDLVPEDKILDKFGYKQIYNDELMNVVNQRLNKLKNSELDVSDYTIKGSVDFLKLLKSKGVKLYLASGTDYQDVIDEARTLGYADFFDGGIYGSVGDVSKYSKKMVIDNIIRENKLHGSQLIVFGDGPVEIRESRKFNGIAVGIASDEVQRFGLNVEKRTRLIKAGAHMIIPDFSQHQKLLNLIF